METKENIWNNEELAHVLKNDGVVVMPTDTIYGILGRAESEAVVNRIYAIRKRNPEKPCIILIGDISELEKFSVALSPLQEAEIKKYWMNFEEESRPTSIVLDCVEEKFAYLHRGTNTLAFRLPASPTLRTLLLKVGPLIAPSANLEEMPPAENIDQAKKYFGHDVDMYMDAGTLAGKASRLIRLLKDGSVTILRA